MPRFVLSEYERFPTLYLDDCSWRGDVMGTEPPGFYPDDFVVDVPDDLLRAWKDATERLGAAERAIRGLTLALQ